MPRTVTLPLERDALFSLHAGDAVLLSGTLYTARDAAHARLAELLGAGKPLPIPRGACIYYAGPCPAAPGEIIGPCGPTTAKRMDSYTPILLEYGVTALIGKGPRSAEVNESLIGRAVYFAATGGAGALYADRVTGCEAVAFSELGAEAVYRLTVRDFPVIVAADAFGRTLFRQDIQKQ